MRRARAGQFGCPETGRGRDISAAHFVISFRESSRYGSQPGTRGKDKALDHRNRREWVYFSPSEPG
jgi:hypothetical protein